MNKEQRSVPKLRFPEFTAPWEQRKLNEVAEFNPKAELPEKFEYVDLESVVGTEMVSHRTETKETAPSRAQRLAQTGDVFFQTVRPYQRNNYLFSKPDNNYVFSTGYAQMRPRIDAEFLMCFLQTDGFVNVVLDNCTGTSYPAINSKDLSNLEISLPDSGDEQRRIGSFISNLDNLITLHQRKLEAMQEYKKGLLQKMFPKEGENVPEVRFPGFTDPWEQRKLGDCCCQMTATLSPQETPDKFFVEYSMPAFDNGEKADVVLGETMNSARKIIDRPCLLINKLNVRKKRIWNIKEPENNAVCSSEFVPVYSDDVDLTFLKYIVSNDLFTSYLEDCSSGSSNSQKRVTPDVIMSAMLMMPLKDEQIKIGEFFQMLDEAITLHQRKLEAMKEYKKGLLQQMFV